MMCTYYQLMTELCESRLIPSRSSLKKWNEKQLRELAYLYFLALRILIAEDETKSWAMSYADKTLPGSDFEHWRTDGNDFYVLLYALSSDEFDDNQSAISKTTVYDWLRHSRSGDFNAITHRLFNRLDAMFHITDSAYKSMRRIVAHWTDTDAAEQQSVLTQVIKYIKKLAPSNCEILAQLEKIPQTDEKIDESASAGATGSGSVASVVGGLGAGFAPTEMWRGIYADKPKKKAKSVVIRREPISSE